MSDHPNELRRRARVLRALAGRMEATPAMSLDAHAGSDTWRTPRGDLCRWILGANQTQVHRAADDLRWSAHRLDERAAEIESERAALGGAS
ncbi:MAG: hypothetical protein WD225_02050 [Ilumatobacteraceae bacterium]